jgi:hypothetical protein
MAMSNYKKIAIIAVMVMIIGVMGCGQDVKPTDDIMKQFIKEQVCGNLINNPAISDIKFETFNITNGFFSRMPGGGGESRGYCIEVNYRIIYIETIDNTIINRDAINRLQYSIRGTEDEIKKRKDDIKIWEKEGAYGMTWGPKVRENYIKQDYNIINMENNNIARLKENLEAWQKKPNIIKENKLITGNERFTFKKRGDIWYGYPGWQE